MQYFQILTPMLFGVFILALGWLLFALIAGIRGGWEAGLRLFLLGFGLLAALLATGAMLLYLPDWAAIILLLFGALLPWLSALRYFVPSYPGGKSLISLLSNSQKWSMSIISGAFFVIFGLSQFFFHNDFFSPAKSYALGISLISLGIFNVMRGIRYVKTREKGF